MYPNQFAYNNFADLRIAREMPVSNKWTGKYIRNGLCWRKVICSFVRDLPNRLVFINKVMGYRDKHASFCACWYSCMCFTVQLRFVWSFSSLLCPALISANIGMIYSYPTVNPLCYFLVKRNHPCYIIVKRGIEEFSSQTARYDWPEVKASVTSLTSAGIEDQNTEAISRQQQRV